MVKYIVVFISFIIFVVAKEQLYNTYPCIILQNNTGYYCSCLVSCQNIGPFLSHEYYVFQINSECKISTISKVCWCPEKNLQGEWHGFKWDTKIFFNDT